MTLQSETLSAISMLTIKKKPSCKCPLCAHNLAHISPDAWSKPTAPEPPFNMTAMGVTQACTTDGMWNYVAAVEQLH